MLPDTLERSWGPWTAATYDRWRLVGFVMRIFQSLFKDVSNTSWMIFLNHLGSNLKFVHLCHSMVFLTICLWAFPVSISRKPRRIRPTCNLPTAVVNSLASLHGTFGSKRKSTMWMCPHVAHWKTLNHRWWPHHYQVHQSLCTSKQRSAHLGGNELTGTAWSLTHTDGPRTVEGQSLWTKRINGPSTIGLFCNKGIFSHGESECFKGSKGYTDWLCFVVTLWNQPP